MVSIRSEVDFFEYLRDGVMPLVEEIKDVVYLDADEDIHARVESYYANSYKGVALFLGLYEGVLGNQGHNGTYTAMGQITVLKKHDKTKPNELIGVRKATREILTMVFGLMQADIEEAIVGDVLNRWEVKLLTNRFNAVSNFANVAAYGYSVDFDLSFGVESVLYPPPAP